MKKKYVVFAEHTYYPSGFPDSVQGVYEKLSEAKQKALDCLHAFQHVTIWNLETLRYHSKSKSSNWSSGTIE